MIDGVPVLRTSERGTFNTCIAQWNWAWREGLVPRAQQMDARWFGSGAHIALALWYCGPGKKRGPHPAETWAKYSKDQISYFKTKKITEEEEAKTVDMAELGRVMLEGYVKKYGKDEHMFVLKPEQTFALDIPWSNRQQLYEFVRGSIMVRYLGTFDLPYRDLRDDKVKIEEHKTANIISTAHLPMDNQGGSYWAIATMVLREMGLIGPRESLAGIEYNFLRKALPDDRPRDAEGYYTNKPTKEHYIQALSGVDGWTEAILRKKKLEELGSIAAANRTMVVGDRSKTQPPPLFLRHWVHRTRAERKSQLQRIQDEAVHIQAVRDGILPITKSPSRMHCSWCDFRDMCQLQDRGGNWQDYKRLMFRSEDKYADHRKSTDE